jgi:glutathione S-transferase
MPKLKLWGHPKSINVQKVLWALDELKLEYERVDIGGAFGKSKEPEYLALNPNGLIPTLQDGDAALWESNSVVRYLFARYGQDPIHPNDPVLRARADAFHEWNTSTFWAHARVLNVQLVRTPEEKRDHAALNAAREKVTHALGILDAHLSRHPYVAGEHFTWGDIPLGTSAQRFFNLPLQRPAAPAVEAWYARIKERPAFKKWIDVPQK